MHITLIAFDDPSHELMFPSIILSLPFDQSTYSFYALQAIVLCSTRNTLPGPE